jgi:hypothetical protein
MLCRAGRHKEFKAQYVKSKPCAASGHDSKRVRGRQLRMPARQSQAVGSIADLLEIFAP